MFTYLFTNQLVDLGSYVAQADDLEFLFFLSTEVIGIHHHTTRHHASVPSTLQADRPPNPMKLSLITSFYLEHYEMLK